VLVFAPHPDDEVAGPGGCIALHRLAGDPVHVVVASTGAAGDPLGRFDRATYAARREQESRAGLVELGGATSEHWGLPDNHDLSPADVERGVQLAAAAVAAFRPDLVYLPWDREGHPDHHHLHCIVHEALTRVAFAGRAFGYEVWNAMVPDLVVDITAVAEQKRRAIRAHASQLAYTDFEHTILGLNAYRSMVHQHGRGYAEALRDLQTRPHDTATRDVTGTDGAA
jgi:LmbE family N-acetylglucosaminyl deacetylase